MKNKYRKLAVIMLTAVCFAGCQQEDIVYPEPDAKVAETYLTLNELTQSPLQVPGPEGTYILKVISDDKWTLSSSQAWCSVLLRYDLPFFGNHESFGSVFQAPYLRDSAFQ